MKILNMAKMAAQQRVLKKPIWYHDFSALGLSTTVIDDSYARAQSVKVPAFVRHFERTFSRFSERDLGAMRGVELFCADAYFSQFALKRGVGQMIGIDLDAESPENRSGVLSQAQIAAAALGTTNRFNVIRGDVREFEGRFDFCVNYGGIYHLLDPLGLLRRCRTQVNGPMLLQTIVSLANTSDDYFESPAPGWTWGSRFSEGYLMTMLDQSGWDVEDVESEVADYNKRPADRGIVFALCRPK